MLKKARDTTTLNFLHSINASLDDDFKRIALHPKYIFAIGEHEKMLTVARLSESVSNKDLYEIEHGWKKTHNNKQ